MNNRLMNFMKKYNEAEVNNDVRKMVLYAIRINRVQNGI